MDQILFFKGENLTNRKYYGLNDTILLRDDMNQTITR